MKERLDVRLSPTEKKALRRVSEARKRSMADTVRILIDEEHGRIVGAQRGETQGITDTTKRGE